MAGDDFEAVGNITERQPRIKAAKKTFLMATCGC
jgi:hypothetical protein